MKQPQYSPLSVAEQVSILFAANEGLLDDIENSRIKDFKDGWFNYFDANMHELSEKLDKGYKLSDDDKVALTNEINKYKLNFFK